VDKKKNQYFSFKQFTIEQDRCAMKVCTDACIFGAYVEVKNAEKILDIGTGTGVLALMMAQRTNAQIDAVEIDEDAYNQAVTNIEQSIFKEKIKVFHSRIQDFGLEKIQTNKLNLAKTPKSEITILKSYDLIISNPPFYQNSLQSLDNQANKAIHAVELTFEELIEAVARLLKYDGKFVVLLPPFETEQLGVIAARFDFFIQHQLLIKHDKNKPVFRIISTFSKIQVVDNEEVTLNIWANDGKSYSNDFRELLQDYYTIF
jgi:tRNA1Val (adenine37-N6)-methyltransferase